MKTNQIRIKGQKKVLDIGSLTGKKKELLKDINPDVIHSNFNGFGYQDHEYTYEVTRTLYNKIKNLLELQKNKVAKPKPTEEQIIERWSKRLVQLTGIDIEEAKEIAKEKINYKNQQINMMERRQWEGVYSERRQRLINKMERENPLRRIQDEDHAHAILAAHNRHKNTNYEYLLDESKQFDHIEDKREYARNNYN